MKLRLALVTTALAFGAAPFATPSASAAVCHPAFEDVCYTLGTGCRILADNPKLPDCPPMG